jgi:hypothetical protein
LPCFDLIFYERVYNGILKREDLIEALFPYDDSSVENHKDPTQVTETVISNSLFIVSRRTAMALRNIPNIINDKSL